MLNMRDDTNFRTGNIYRIYMKNFLTYDEIEIYPKAHLNVVIGPNGTGKSSILCGICIGLSGKPELTGRGKSLSEYIKQGKESAVIEIELFNKEGRMNNDIFRREFTVSHNRWYLQNKEVKQKEIEAKVASLGIHVNNLCQFLPQDRVAEFAKMNKIQLLASTEMAVGETELFDQHQILSQSGKTIQEKNGKLNEVRNQLDIEIKKNHLLKDQVRNIQQKEELNKAIEELNQVILFYKYTELRKELTQIQEPISRLTKECEALTTKMKPNEAHASKINKKLNQCHEKEKKNSEESKNYSKEKENLVREVEENEDAITLAFEEYRRLVTSNCKREKEINDFKRMVEVYRMQLAECQDVDESEIKQKQQTLVEKMCVCSNDLQTIQAQISESENEIIAISSQKNDLLQRIRNTKARCLELLLPRNREVHSAVMWLEKNRGLFRAPVHNPLYLTIDFTDSSYSKYLEKIVSKQDLIAFVCEDKSDVKTLKKYADSKKWPINILHSAPLDSTNYRSTLPIQSIRQLGFKNFIKDVVVAPPAIMSFLCRIYNIHNIPFAEVADSNKVPRQFTSFFIGNYHYIKKKSRYDYLWQTTQHEIKRPYYFSILKDPVAEKRLQEKLESLIERSKQLEASLKKLKNEEPEMEKNLERLRVENQNLTMASDKRKILQQTMINKEEQIKRRQREVIDLTVAKQNMHTKVKRAIGTMLEIAERHSELESKVTAFTQQILCECLTLCKLYREKRALRSEMENDREEKINKQEEKKKLELQKQEYDKNARELLKKFCTALGLTNHSQITTNLQIRTQFTKKINENTLEEYENKLARKIAHRKCITTSDDSVLIEYKKREEKIAELSAKEKDIMASIEQQNESVKTCQTSWLFRITELISQINTHFSDFMAQLGCAGEVQLDKGTKENDFSQYGLAVRVKFRDTEKLKELTVHQQSGGERSVSTALFLMALQTLTAVPFRCVDEINQGMDPTNERKMFTMLVQTTTTETASQYFLITPKLLPNLPYNSRVNFLNISSWWSSSSTRHLNVSKIFANYKKRNSRQITRS